MLRLTHCQRGRLFKEAYSPVELRQLLLDFLSTFAGINEANAAALADLSNWEAD
jgi:hypothetical protein